MLSRILTVLVLVYIVVMEPPKILGPWLLQVLEWIGFFLICTATVGRIWCLIYIAGKKNEALAHWGPYSIMRNPLYVFSFLGVIGLGLVVENPLLALVLGTLFVFLYSFVVRDEEKHLTSIFGAEYQGYCAQTPRWIPNFRLYREPQTLTINPAKIREGILDSMWFLWAFLLWEVLEQLRESGILPALF